MAAPKYKLTYSDYRCHAEFIRLIFAAAGVDFEDVRYSDEEWPEKRRAEDPERERYLFSKVPILEFDGLVLAESMAIAQYLGNEFGLGGTSNLEKARITMVMSAISEIYEPLVINVWYEEDKPRKAAWYKKLKDLLLPRLLTALEKLLTENRGGDGYLIGENLTVADLVFVDKVDFMLFHSSPDMLNSYPKLKALKERVEALPKIAEWIKTRPYTPDFEYK